MPTLSTRAMVEQNVVAAMMMMMLLAALFLY
jgi:hypothetical protein